MERDSLHPGQGARVMDVEAIRKRWAGKDSRDADDIAALLAEVERMRPAYEAIVALGRACGRGERAKAALDLREAHAADVDCNAAMDALVKLGAEHANAPLLPAGGASEGGG